jgi:hypothetical protein
MRDIVLATGKIWAGLAILEDGFDQTAELHAVRPQDLARVEPQLMARHQQYFPRLPIDDINVLVVDSIGKNFSGTGMDTNVVGHRGSRGCEDGEGPQINILAALTLAESSQGNGLGVGLADFITARLRDAINIEKTFVNSFTTGNMQLVKIPMAFADDQQLFERLAERFGEHGWLVIPNTLHLETLYASPDLREALEANPICTVESEIEKVSFRDGRHTLRFGV